MVFFGQLAESPGQWMITGQLFIAIGTQHQNLPFRDAAKSFIISLRASNRYKPSYLSTLETSPAFLCELAEEQGWPGVSDLTTSHLEEYLAHFANRPRWFGERGEGKVPSQSYVESQYRRLKRFFGWMVTRGHQISFQSSAFSPRAAALRV